MKNQEKIKRTLLDFHGFTIFNRKLGNLHHYLILLKKRKKGTGYFNPLFTCSENSSKYISIFIINPMSLFYLIDTELFKLPKKLKNLHHIYFHHANL